MCRAVRELAIGFNRADGLDDDDLAEDVDSTSSLAQRFRTWR
jgi:hypothetical protein